jgi:hypothetical protein
MTPDDDFKFQVYSRKTPRGAISSIGPFRFEPPPARGEAYVAWESAVLQRSRELLSAAGLRLITTVPLDPDDVLTHDGGEGAQLVGQFIVAHGSGEYRREALALVWYLTTGEVSIRHGS